MLGSSIYHVGIQVARWSKSQELNVLTQAMYHARELAMERMQEESRRDQAHGVVGVRVEEKSHVWGSHAIEFLAIGTAVCKMRQRATSPKPGLVLSLG